MEKNEDYDFDERMDARQQVAEEAAYERRRFGCQCGNDLPGSCPGAINCEFSDCFESAEENEE